MKLRSALHRANGEIQTRAHSPRYQKHPLAIHSRPRQHHHAGCSRPKTPNDQELAGHPQGGGQWHTHSTWTRACPRQVHRITHLRPFHNPPAHLFHSQNLSPTHPCKEHSPLRRSQSNLLMNPHVSRVHLSLFKERQTFSPHNSSRHRHPHYHRRLPCRQDYQAHKWRHVVLLEPAQSLTPRSVALTHSLPMSLHTATLLNASPT
jgi:hypothetical protein